MQLIRNETESGVGKYIVLKVQGTGMEPRTVEDVVEMIKQHPDCVQFGRVGEPDEFFVVKLKDINAPGALNGYAVLAGKNGDVELATEVAELSIRSGSNHPNCKVPD
jgi:hypothetical protein